MSSAPSNTQRLPRRLIRMAALGLTSSGLAALSCGWLEAVLFSRGGARVVVSTLLTATLLPLFLLFLSLLAGLGILRASRLYVAQHRDLRGAIPRVCGAAWTGLVLLVLAAMGFAYASDWLVNQTASSNVYVLFAPVWTIVSCSLALFMCVPVFHLFDRFFFWLGHTRLWRLTTPSGLFVSLAAAILLSACLAWKLFFEPRLGGFSLRFSTTLVCALPIFVGWLWLTQQFLVRRLRAACAVVFIAMIVHGGLTLWALWQRPLWWINGWADSNLAGVLTEEFIDIDKLHFKAHGASLKLAEASTSHPDIVLITIDTLRADMLGMYGGPAPAPGLLQLANSGTLFERAFSPSNVTRRSIPAFFTGLSPFRISGRVIGWGLRLDPRHVALGERLTANGYQYNGFLCCEKLLGPSPEMGLTRGLKHSEIWREGGILAMRMASFLRKIPANAPPQFTWAHFMDLHAWDERGVYAKGTLGKKHYTQAIAPLDALVRMVANFAAQNQRDTIFIITSDHGEALGDHDTPYHSNYLYNAETHVPLIVFGPTIGKRRIAQAVSLLDLVPTLLDLAGFVVPESLELDGRSLAPLLRGTERDAIENGRAYLATVRDRSTLHDQRAWVQGRYKLIVGKTKRPELYDIFADPGETNNLAAIKRDIVQAMQNQMRIQEKRDQQSPFAD